MGHNYMGHNYMGRKYRSVMQARPSSLASSTTHSAINLVAEYLRTYMHIVMALCSYVRYSYGLVAEYLRIYMYNVVYSYGPMQSCPM